MSTAKSAFSCLTHRRPQASSGGTSPKRPDESMLFDSKIYLGEAFFNEIIRAPGAARYEHPESTVKRSSLGLDLVSVADLSHLCTSKRPLRLSWRQLYRQFGLAHPAQAGDKNIC